MSVNHIRALERDNASLRDELAGAKADYTSAAVDKQRCREELDDARAAITRQSDEIINAHRLIGYWQDKFANTERELGEAKAAYTNVCAFYESVYDELRAAERERDETKAENWALKQALGYSIPADKETINNPFKCGTCNANRISAEQAERERDEARAFINAKQLQKPLADWSGIPRDLYVVEASTDGVVYDVKLCSAPMAIGPEVRYTRAETAERERDEARAALRQIADRTGAEVDEPWSQARARAALAKGDKT